MRGDFAEGDAAAFADSVDGVADEIGENLADFAVVRHNEGDGAAIADDFDVLTAEAGVEEGKDGVDELVDVGHGGAGRPTVETEGLDGDLGDAVKFFLGELEEGARFVGEGELLDEVEAVGDGFERIVDLVGDGGGEAAGDGELFGAAEDFFAFFLEGQIGDEGGELLFGDGGFRVEDGDADEDVDGLPGVGDADAFEGLGGDGGLRGVVEALAEVAERGAEVSEADEAGDDAAAGIAEQALEGGVGIDDPAGHFADEEAERHGLDEAVEAGFAFAEGALGGDLEATGGGFLELALEGGDEADEILLGDVVVGAGAHGFNGGLFGDSAGHHDEGDVEAGGFETLEGGGPAEIGEIVVGEDEVGDVGGKEHLLHLGGGFNAGDIGREAVSPEITLDEEGVIRIVFDQQHAERPRLRRGL